MLTLQSSTVVKEFESVELGDAVKKQKVPRRTIYFASGETMEEFSTDDEDEEEEQERRKQTVMSTIDPVCVCVCVCVRERESVFVLTVCFPNEIHQFTVSLCLQSKLTWGPYFWFHMWRVATSTISVCDYLGEKMASLLGITTPKYQYAIDEYYRMKKEEEEADEEDRLSEEAQQRFDNQHRDTEQKPTVEQPEGTSSFVNMSFEGEQETSS
ncbi:protein FAM [Clarias magur]|uniref:Protein FAM n=1 Tax=Clarias magur TaxID=1594786 RepID=A0A8J4WUE2_CLAMG|nr:protein FAM [Clarias magur]